MHTPGHTSDSICLWHASSRTLLCADTVLGWGSAMVSDLGDYMQSLHALRALDPQPLALLPGHGPPIVPQQQQQQQQQQQGVTPLQLIQQYIDHRSARIAQACCPSPSALGLLLSHPHCVAAGACCRAKAVGARRRLSRAENAPRN